MKYRVKLVPVQFQVFERVFLVELERVTRLRFNVNPDNIKPCAMIAHSRSTLTAE
jgi:hypothetical protein